LLVATAAPALTTADSDLDGVNDLSEGLIDSWDSGLADYMNPMSDSFAIPDQVVAGTASRALETQPGLTLHVGAKSLSSGGTGALLATPPADVGFTHTSGVYDVEIHGVQTGSTATVVIPLQSAASGGATYRQYTASDSSWHNFAGTTADTVYSAPAKNGVCPGISSSTWTAGLSSGAQCVKLTITDGGVNDADGVADGVVTNLGGVAAPMASSSSSSASAGSGGKSGGGGAFGWPLLLTLSVFTALIYLRRRTLHKAKM